MRLESACSSATLVSKQPAGVLMPSIEVELKFALPPGAAAALEAHPLLQGATETDERQHAATYFDTARHDLRKAQIACRIRDEAGRRVQTVKASTGDATARHEWEQPAAGETPDLADVPLSRALRKAVSIAALAPMFTVSVERRIWMLSHGTSLIEAAFDRGWIVADARTVPVCEFELELKQGDPRDLFDLARALAADLPLDLDLRAKAQRGWALKDGTDEIVRDTPVPALVPGASFASGFTTLAQACLEPLSANVPVLRATQSPDALHRTRTAMRRLRALMRVFSRHLRDDVFDDLCGELKYLSRALGAARDLDVADKRLDLGDTLQIRREIAYARVQDVLAAPRYRRLLIDLSAWLTGGAWRTRKPKKQTRGTIGDIVALELHRWDSRIRKGAEAMHDLDPDERHKVRIRAKSLAYVCELTAGLVASRARKERMAYLKALKAMQSALGELNDARVSAALLDDLASEADKDVLRNATRRNTRDADKLETASQKAFVRFLETPRPFDGA